jgi:ABC-type glycerol-3-phosphate transport system substrate-binding protein
MNSVKPFSWGTSARVVVAIALAATAADAHRAVQASSPVTVTIWSWRSQDAPMWDQVQKILQKRGENIHIDFTSKIATEYDAALQTAMTGGKGPDIFYGRAGVGTVNYAAANLIAPLGGKVDFTDVSRSVRTLPKPTAYWTRKPQVFWYVDGDFALNSHISSKAEAAAALKVIQFTATPQFGRLFTDIAGEISPISGVAIPSRYPLSVEAYHQFQTDRIDPTFDIRSPIDTPPPAPLSREGRSKTASSDMGIFSAVMSVVTPLITNKMSPEQATAKIEKSLSWYFKR